MVPKMVSHRSSGYIKSLMNNLAGLYYSQGDYVSVLPLLQECLAKFTIHLGVNHHQSGYPQYRTYLKDLSVENIASADLHAW